jgi:hypothetical protein
VKTRIAALALLLGCGSAETAPVVDAGTDASIARFAECGRCHVAIAADHTASMHAQAFDDALFQREWSHGHPSWCVGCHAPEAESADDPRAHRGVGCASCHVVDGAIVSRHASRDAPHATRADEQFTGVERCGTCHEFDFPSRHGHHEPLQRTLTEWRASGRRERCADCHMPEGSHRLRGPREAALIESALDVDVSAERRGRTTVVHASLRVTGAGHAVPTGDLNRRLVFRAAAPGAMPVEAEMSRVFERDEDGESIEIADQRVLPGIERRLELTLPRASRVEWSLAWDALASDEAGAEIEPSFRAQTLAHGTVRVAP